MRLNLYEIFNHSRPECWRCECWRPRPARASLLVAAERGAGPGAQCGLVCPRAFSLAWSMTSSRFLASTARACAAVSICFLYSCCRLVMTYCWASFILLMSSPRSEFSSFWAISICKDKRVRSASCSQHSGHSQVLFLGASRSRNFLTSP